ncbi:hypothetical protein U9M48_040753 [Paspalum notatum var. saurae]|uniref:Uncharacterized protein n=1 Tax=Paspalum notatum var. saurae TaxID=547442 RepID=A0AAQ3XCP6_PASNO
MVAAPCRRRCGPPGRRRGGVGLPRHPPSSRRVRSSCGRTGSPSSSWSSFLVFGGAGLLAAADVPDGVAFGSSPSPFFALAGMRFGHRRPPSAAVRAVGPSGRRLLLPLGRFPLVVPLLRLVAVLWLCLSLWVVVLVVCTLGALPVSAVVVCLVALFGPSMLLRVVPW